MIGGDILAKKSRTSRKKALKKAKRRLVIFAPISAVIIAYFLISSTNYILNILALNQEKKDLEQSLILLKEDEDNLKNEIQKLKDPDYIARFARENYLYSKNGEYIIKIEDKEEKKQKSDYKINYQYLKYVTTGCVIFGLFIVMLIIKKR